MKDFSNLNRSIIKKTYMITWHQMYWVLDPVGTPQINPSTCLQHKSVYRSGVNSAVSCIEVVYKYTKQL